MMPVSILEPKVGAFDITINPILTWSIYKDALWYEVSLSKDPTFNIPELSHKINNSFYVVDPPLQYETTYYWRVRSITAEPYVIGTSLITPATPWLMGIFTTESKPVSSTLLTREVRPSQVFVSHTQNDIEFCDIFDRACARVGIKAFRSEFEKMDLPAWRTIKDAISNSYALFLLIGKELVRAQSSPNALWSYTQNWIAYEVGVACEKEIDVWVICDDTTINFPVPYLNNYLPLSIRNREYFDYFVNILRGYTKGMKTTFPSEKSVIQCQHAECKAIYNLNIRISSGIKIVCPQCLHPIELPEGWPPN